MTSIKIVVATEKDLVYLPDIENALNEAAKVKGTGIAVRTREYLTSKILEGKSVIASDEQGNWAGFCYIESWGHKKFVANSGLVVDPRFRGLGLAKQIKAKAFELSSKLFPGASMFGLTTSLAVMKINTSLGYKPVTYSELTDDDEFWKGCQTCPYYDILVRTKRSHCLCTAMLNENKEEVQNSKKEDKEQAA